MRKAAEKVLRAWESGRGLPDALGELRHAVEEPDGESHAMRLADELDSWPQSACSEAAAELRRLHAAHQHQYEMAGLMLREAERNGRERDTLLEALRDLVERTAPICELSYGDKVEAAFDAARAAIAKVEGEK